MGAAPERAVTIAQVAVDAAPAHLVRRVIRVRQREALEHAELRLDQIQPRGRGWRRYGMDSETAQQPQEARVIMNVMQIVHDHEEPLPGIAGPQPPERVADFGDSLAAAKHAVETVGMHIVEPQEVLGPVRTPIRRPHPRRALLAGPSHTAHRPQFQRPPFIEANYRCAPRAAPVEPADAFFLRSKAGSDEVFHVRTRWAVRPSRRRRRRTHSSVTGGSNRWRRQYSASLGTDQTENGSPRSAGLDSATSTNSRSCSALRIGGRPLGFDTRSNVAHPLSLNQRSQSYAAVQWHPTRSSASNTLRPLRTSSMMRYRWCTRTDRDKSLSFSCNTRCSFRVSGRSRTGLGIPSLLEGQGTI